MNAGFEEIIGIRGNSNLPSRFGLYLNDLPILSWPTIADYAPSGKSAEDFFNDTYEVSVNDVIGKTGSELSRYFETNNVIDYCQAGRYNDVLTFNTASNVWRGIKITQNNRPGCFNPDPVACIVVNDFDYCGNTSGSIDFRVRDINGNLWTKTYAGYVAGTVITVNVGIKSRQKFVYVESNNNLIATAKSKVGSCPGGCTVTSVGNNLKMEGFNGTTTGSEAYGLIVRASLVCDEEKLNTLFVESYPWRQALLYQLAGNILAHSIVPTTRTTPANIRQLEERQEQRNEWDKQVNTHLKKFREGSVDLMRKLSNKTGCITCTGGYFVG